MQKDFMGMAQGQQAPQQKPITEEDIPTPEMYEEMGLPTGDTPEDAKKRMLAIFEELGILKRLDPEGLKELTDKIDEYIKLAQEGNMEALETHPIGQLLAKASSEIMQMQQPTGGPVPQQGAAPKDFASMMPPTPGGGMRGR